jgi:AraC family transcriptional regulator
MERARRLLDPVVPGGFAGEFGPLHGPLLDDPFMSGLCERMWEEAMGENPAGRLFLDGAVSALLVALLRRSRGMAGMPPGPAAPTRGGLAPWRLRRALDLLEARLAEDVGLDELAAAAGLHPTHFARAFRSTTGTSPHRHLLARRIERAKELLAGTGKPLAEVAALCGFADQSHLGSWFRRLTGTTPRRFRDAARV